MSDMGVLRFFSRVWAGLNDPDDYFSSRRE
ncbi:hypothetical protein RCCS2_01618 [Roseobacter sp. CCS2]|nr:hypothetical protein RCCS2_01618 [Roseobacter sp. CCS2]